MLALMDWLVKRQPWIGKSLVNRHLRDGTLLLHDVTSTYLEGSKCPLAAFGCNRDGKKGKKQLVIGLLCTTEGCPVAVEVFAGNTGDPATIAGQVGKRFGIRNIALAGDRVMEPIHPDFPGERIPVSGRRGGGSGRNCRWRKVSYRKGPR